MRSQDLDQETKLERIKHNSRNTKGECRQQEAIASIVAPLSTRAANEKDHSADHCRNQSDDFHNSWPPRRARQRSTYPAKEVPDTAWSTERAHIPPWQYMKAGPLSASSVFLTQYSRNFDWRSGDNLFVCTEPFQLVRCIESAPIHVRDCFRCRSSTCSSLNQVPVAPVHCRVQVDSLYLVERLPDSARIPRNVLVNIQANTFLRWASKNTLQARWFVAISRLTNTFQNLFLRKMKVRGARNVDHSAEVTRYDNFANLPIMARGVEELGHISECDSPLRSRPAIRRVHPTLDAPPAELQGRTEVADAHDFKTSTFTTAHTSPSSEGRRAVGSGVRGNLCAVVFMSSNRPLCCCTSGGEGSASAHCRHAFDHDRGALKRLSGVAYSLEGGPHRLLRHRTGAETADAELITSNTTNREVGDAH